MRSMTGYAALDADGHHWELRSVNGRGADLRLRLPGPAGHLEPALRAAVSAVLTRGTATLTLRLSEGSAPSRAALDEGGLHAALDALTTIAAEAARRGVDLMPGKATDILAIRSVWDLRDVDVGPAEDRIDADVPKLVRAFDTDRRREGAALAATISGHLDGLTELLDRATALTPRAAQAAADGLRAAVARLAEAGAPDEGRLAQELAMLAVRADVAEETDRLAAHVAAARDLLTADEAVGRRLDFLAQEMGREANTLTAKVHLPDLKAVGLEMKVVIDRLREQAQNVE